MLPPFVHSPANPARVRTARRYHWAGSPTPSGIPAPRLETVFAGDKHPPGEHAAWEMWSPSRLLRPVFSLPDAGQISFPSTILRLPCRYLLPTSPLHRMRADTAPFGSHRRPATRGSWPAIGEFGVNANRR